MHHQVHNVIEPVSHGVPVVVGPNYHSQREARLFVARGLVSVVDSAGELSQWWQQHAEGRKEVNVDFAKMLTGASDKVMKILEAAT